MVELDRPHMTIRRVHFAYQIIKGTDTHLEYVILIAFPRQFYSVRTLPVLFIMATVLMSARDLHLFCRHLTLTQFAGAGGHPVGANGSERHDC
jgi:hypothetical protein